MRQKLNKSYSGLETIIDERTAALREAQFQISHQEKMASLGLLAAGVAHEIGNPLTSISSMAQLIKRKVKDQQFIEYLNTILKNIERISTIVRELVDFARPASYKSDFVDINEIIRNAVSIIKYDKRAKKIDIKLKLDTDIPLLFLVSDQLLQVCLNILINAVDALKNDNDKIIVKTKHLDGTYIIQIEDTGIGIDKDQVSKIFEPFFTTKKVGKGTGLGLSVSYGIIKNLNGSIDVESEKGKGSVFTISLPANLSERKNEG
jgi:signal transduction histidine kinase